jgi:hypothetical protein
MTLTRRRIDRLVLKAAARDGAQRARSRLALDLMPSIDFNCRAAADSEAESTRRVPVRMTRAHRRSTQRRSTPSSRIGRIDRAPRQATPHRSAHAFDIRHSLY